VAAHRLTAVLTGEHHSPPRLDDVAEWPQIPALPGGVQRLVQLPLEAGAVDVGQGRADQLDPLGQVWAARPLGHARHASSPSRPGLPAHQCDTAR